MNEDTLRKYMSLSGKVTVVTGGSSGIGCASALARARLGARVALLNRDSQREPAQADVFIQNLAPDVAERLGLGSDALRDKHARLITCDISGYGDDCELMGMEAYDLLVQAESGLISVSGAPGEWGRIGVSLCDINCGC